MSEARKEAHKLAKEIMAKDPKLTRQDALSIAFKEMKEKKRSDQKTKIYKLPGIFQKNNDHGMKETIILPDLSNVKSPGLKKPEDYRNIDTNEADEPDTVSDKKQKARMHTRLADDNKRMESMRKEYDDRTQRKCVYCGEDISTYPADKDTCVECNNRIVKRAKAGDKS